MITNALVITFVSSFVAIVVLGHILLLAALWPDLVRRWRKPEHAPDAETGSKPARYSPQPN